MRSAVGHNPQACKTLKCARGSIRTPPPEANRAVSNTSLNDEAGTCRA